MLLEQEIKSENKAQQLIQNKNEDCLLIFNLSVIEINFQYCSHLILRSFLDVRLGYRGTSNLSIQISDPLPLH